MKSILEDFQPELFTPQEMASFKIAPELGKVSFANQSKGHGSNILWIIVQGKKAGYIDYWIDPAHPTWLEIKMSRIEPHYRGRGLGLLLYQRFYRHIVRNFPRVRSIDGRVTSKGIAALRQRAIKSEPRFADPGTGNDMSREDAMDYIPDKSPEAEDGSIDGVGVQMQQKIRRKGVRAESLLSESVVASHDLPQDMQQLISDWCDGVDEKYKTDFAGRFANASFTVHVYPVSKFPVIEVGDSGGGRGQSTVDGMAADRDALPPVVVCGKLWLDGRHRIAALRKSGETSVRVIDLREMGLKPSMLLKTGGTLGELHEGEFTPGFDVDPETLRPVETTHVIGRRRLSARATFPRPFAVTFDGRKSEHTTASTPSQALTNILGRLGKKNPYKSIGIAYASITRDPVSHRLAIFDEHFQCYVQIRPLPEAERLTRDPKAYLEPSIDVSDDIPTNIFVQQDGALWIARDAEGNMLAATASRAGTIQQALAKLHVQRALE